MGWTRGKITSSSNWLEEACMFVIGVVMSVTWEASCWRGTTATEHREQCVFVRGVHMFCMPQLFDH